MDPWGATEPMSWWTIVNRCRALENTAFVVAANQGASLRHYPPYSWPGGSQIVDFDGRMLAEASPGPGERIVVAPLDISALRHERETARTLDAGALAHGGVPGLRHAALSTRPANGGARRAVVVPAEPRAHRDGEAAHRCGFRL